MRTSSSNNNSQKTSSWGTPTIFSIGIIVSWALCYLYVKATYFLPFNPLNVLMCGMLSMAIGTTVQLSCKWLKITSRKFLIFAAAVLGLITLCFVWMFWFQNYLSLSYPILSYDHIETAINRYVQRGRWQMFNLPVAEEALYIFWTFEAGIIIGFTVAFALQPINKLRWPFGPRSLSG